VCAKHPLPAAYRVTKTLVITRETGRGFTDQVLAAQQWNGGVPSTRESPIP
jgi:hypothetical protein